MLKNIFEELQNNKDNFLKSETGADFENRIQTCLKKNHFSEIYKSDFDTKEEIIDFKKIKSQITDKRNEDIILNNFEGLQFKNTYIYQPYGSQNFPDFLIFTEKHIIALEIKYTKKRATHPMWNSNLPKSNAVYIFGSYGAKDITFFLGKDILPANERNLLLDFFDELEMDTKKFKDKMEKLYKVKTTFFDKGFMVYVRKAYTQDKGINKNAETNYFKFNDRVKLEQNVIEYIKKI